ncbi:hypothetical protein ACWECC_33180 [Streptomyces microflavus]
MHLPETCTPHTPFLGLPVEGVAEYGIQQRPAEELRPLFEAVLNDLTVVEFGWQQYTPFDPGSFGVRYLWVRTIEEPPAATERDLWLMEGCPSLGDTYGPNREHYRGPDRDRFERVMALHHALEEGGFDDALRQAFGDPTAVTVRRDGIRVALCDHD